MSVAHIVIRGLSPISFSRKHAEPKLEGEKPDDYEARTWRSKVTVSRTTGNVVIPAHG